ncbi:herpesviridae UL52/UL70 DNA primase [Trichuris suis]|nr:herpesviridae UL52/UL70 DNA primase [Trichuris suis]
MPIDGINASVFYGSNSTRPKSSLQLSIEERIIYNQEHPLFEPHRYSLIDDRCVWRAFRCQADAMKYLETRIVQDKLKIFSFESHLSSGGRTFLVVAAEHFWSVYKQLPNNMRHCYEMIREGQPCRLYFDLEFYFCTNPDMNGELCVKSFVAYFREKASELLGIEISTDCILDLDSTTEEKFSRHLIVHLPNGTVFKDNKEAGNFVKDMCSALRSLSEEQRRERCLSCLFVLTKEGKETLLCDEGVYTRNRTFRLYLSSKLKQHNPLTLASSCNFYSSKGRVPSEEDIFFDSLIEAMSYKHSISYTPQFCTQFAVNFSNLREQFTDVSEGINCPLPFPGLNRFFEDYLSQQKAQARIRRWIHVKSAGLLILDIANYRYCHRIGREHKSNHIMYIVDLRRCLFYQKCHDQECRLMGYRSNDFPFPPCLLERKHGSVFDDSVSDEQFEKMVSEFERQGTFSS